MTPETFPIIGVARRQNHYRHFLAGQGRSRIDCLGAHHVGVSQMQQANRRRFLFVAAGGLGTAALGGAMLRDEVRWPVVTRTAKALGTEVSITVRHRSPASAENAIEAAFEELALVERLMSIYRPDSQVSMLNRDWPDRGPASTMSARCCGTPRWFRSRPAGPSTSPSSRCGSLFAAAAKEQRLPARRGSCRRPEAKVDWTQRRCRQPDCVRLWQPGTADHAQRHRPGLCGRSRAGGAAGAGIEHALINAGEHAPLGAIRSRRRLDRRHPAPAHEDAYVALADWTAAAWPPPAIMPRRSPPIAATTTSSIRGPAIRRRSWPASRPRADRHAGRRAIHRALCARRGKGLGAGSPHCPAPTRSSSSRMAGRSSPAAFRWSTEGRPA